MVGADQEHLVNGRCVLGRKTKWGIIEGQCGDSGRTLGQKPGQALYLWHPWPLTRPGVMKPTDREHLVPCLSRGEICHLILKWTSWEHQPHRTSGGGRATTLHSAQHPERCPQGSMKLMVFLLCAGPYYVHFPRGDMMKTALRRTLSP